MVKIQEEEFLRKEKDLYVVYLSSWLKMVNSWSNMCNPMYLRWVTQLTNLEDEMEGAKHSTS